MRVSVSNVDAYLRYKRNEDVTLDDLLAQLRRETPPTENMLAGTAFHKLLEGADIGEIHDAVVDGFTFRIDVDAEIFLPKLREIKGVCLYDIGGTQVDLVGIVDTLDGVTVSDHKLTGRFDPERYTDAFQWRAYLSMFGADRFIYNVFTARKDIDGVWVVSAFDRFPLYRYPALDADVRRMLTEYVHFAMNHLEEKAA